MAGFCNISTRNSFIREHSGVLADSMLLARIPFSVVAARCYAATTVKDVLKIRVKKSGQGRRGRKHGGGQRAEAEAEKSRLLNYPTPQLSRSVSSPPAHFVFHSRMFSELPSFFHATFVLLLSFLVRSPFLSVSLVPINHVLSRLLLEHSEPQSGLFLR